MKNRVLRSQGFNLRTVGWMVLFLPWISRAQDAAPPQAGGSIFPLSPVGIAVASLLGVLLALLIICGILLAVYRSRSIRLSMKCLMIEPELKRTYESLQETTEKLTETTRTLNEEVLLHDRFLTESGAAVYKLDRDGKCTFINPQLEKLCGLTRQRILRKGLIDLVHPDDRAQVREEWRTFAEREGACNSTFRLLRDDGTLVHVACRASTLRDVKKEVTGYIGLLVDVTDWVAASEASRTAERRSNFFVQESVGGFFELRPDQPIATDLPPNEMADLIFKTMSIAVCNSTLADLYGSSTSELTGARLNELAGGCGMFENPERVKEFVAAGFKLIGTEVIRKDRRGNHLYLSNDMVGIIEDGYLVSVWGAQHDVSRQRRETERLVSRVGFLQSILDTLPADVFVKDTRCRFLYVSRHFAGRTGIPVEDWIDKTIFEVMPATPRNVNKNSIEVMKTGGMSRAVDASHTPDGVAWIETLETPLISEDGLIEGVVGMALDVTAHTEERLALKQSLEQFRSLVENDPNGILVAECQSKRITYANPALCDFLGYTEAELVDMHIGDLHSPGSRRQVLAEWDERARHRRRFEQALPCLRKDRAVVLADVGVSIGRLGEKEVLLGTYSDASGRQKVEAELVGQRDYQKYLLAHSAAFLAVVDRGGAIRFVNESLRDALGYDDGELAGKPYVTTLVAAQDHDQLANAFAYGDAGRDAEFEYQLVTRKGENLAALCRIRPLLNSASKLDGFSIVGIDVTQRWIHDEQMRVLREQLTEKLAQCNERLDAAVQAHQQAVQDLDLAAAEKKQQDEAMQLREQSFEQERAERIQQEEQLRQTVADLESQKSSLEESLAQCRSDLEQAAEQRVQLESVLQEQQETAIREREAFNADVEQRMGALNQTLAERETHLEELRQTIAGLESQKSSLEESLAQCRSDLEQAAEQRVQLESTLQDHQETALREREALRQEDQQRISALEEALDERQVRQEQLLLVIADLEHQKSSLEESLKKTLRELKQSAEQRDQLDAALKEQQEAFGREREAFNADVEQRTSALGQELSAREQREAQLQKTIAELEQHKVELEDGLLSRQSELAQAAAQREELERMLAQSREEFERDREALRIEIEQRTKTLEKEIEERRSREELLEKTREKLSRHRAELEEALGARTEELEAQIAKRKAEESALRKMSKELKELQESSSSEKETLAQHVAQCKAEVAKSRSAEQALRQREAKLPQKIKELEAQIEQRTQDAKKEAAEREKIEKELLQFSEQCKAEEARSRSAEEALRQLEAGVPQQIKELEVVIAQRTQAVAQEVAERQKVEKRLAELEAQCQIAVAENVATGQALQQMQAVLPKRIKELEELVAQRTRAAEHEAAERKKTEAKLIELNALRVEEAANTRNTSQALRQLESELPRRIRELERQLEQRAKEVAKESAARDAAERKLARLSESLKADHQLAVELHDEVSSSLNPVLDLSDSLLKDESLPEERRQQVQAVNRNSRQMLDIMKYRMELTSLADVQVEAEAFDLQDFIEDVGVEFTEKSKSKNLFFGVSASGEVSGRIVADREKVRLVLGNLLDYALECTSRGQIGLNAICEKLDDGRKKIGFQLMCSGLSQDVDALAGMLDSSVEAKPFRDMTDAEFKMDLTRRYAELLGGSLRLENRSGYKPFLNLVLTVEQEQDVDANLLVAVE